jgi:hypothetical protein
MDSQYNVFQMELQSEAKVYYEWAGKKHGCDEKVLDCLFFLQYAHWESSVI